MINPLVQHVWEEPIEAEALAFNVQFNVIHALPLITVTNALLAINKLVILTNAER